ncbi:MAG: hypothetical protein KDD69_03075 [Bdellovibrionales bacterium]|nr:hypothetical protein [Bdellovibrionales bacterium]
MLSKAEERFIREQLRAFDCTEREVDIYLALVQRGGSSVQEIADVLSQNRITVHSASAQMLRKGLLVETRRGKRRLLTATEPDELFRLVKIKQQELELMQLNLGYAVGLLRREQKANSSRPGVQFHEGVEGFKRMLEMSLAAKGEFLGLIDVELFSRLLSAEYLLSFFRRRAEKGISSRLVWPSRGAFAKESLPQAKEYRISVRFLPADQEWRSGFISWNNCISLKSFTAGKVTCTIIENEDIAFFYRNYIFETVWKNAIPPTRMR